MHQPRDSVALVERDVGALLVDQFGACPRFGVGALVEVGDGPPSLESAEGRNDPPVIGQVIDCAFECIALAKNFWNSVLETIGQPLHLLFK